MAVANPDKEQQEAKYNPSREDYQTKFAQPNATHAANGNESGEQTPAHGESQNSNKSVGDNLKSLEASAAEQQTPTSPAESEDSAQFFYNPQQQGPGKSKTLFGGIANSALKKWGLGLGATGIIGIMALMLGGVGNFVINLKEGWADRTTGPHYSAATKRTQKLQNRWFKEPGANCGLSIFCRLNSGVSDKELDHFKKSGLEPEIGETKEGKKWIKSFTSTDPKTGVKTRITADNFAHAYENDLNFRKGLCKILCNVRALVWRGKRAVSHYSFLGYLRSRLDKTKEKWRERTLAKKGNLPVKELLGDEEAEKIDKAADEVRDGAQKDLTKDPSIHTPDQTKLNGDPEKAAATPPTLTGLKGAVLSAFTGFLGIADKACTVYNGLRLVTIGAKLIKAAALMQFALAFLTTADSIKAGKGDLQNISLMAGMLVRPSTEQATLGYTAANSSLFSLVNGGKVNAVPGLTYGVVGTALLSYVAYAKTFAEKYGANKGFCQAVKSWIGQAGILASGLLLAFFTEGASALVGAASSFLTGYLFSLAVEHVTPILIQYISGAITPGPDHPGGGYAIGEAIAGGLGAFGSQLGKTGLRPLTNDEAQTAAAETSAEMAKIQAMDQMGKSPFSPDSPNSITSRLAMTLFPYIAAPLSQMNYQSVATLAMSPFALVGNAMNQLFVQRVGALGTNFGGQYCADEEIQAMDLVTDADCNIIAGELTTTLDNPVYSPEAVMHYMVDNNYVNESGGTPKAGANGDIFQKFLASCVEPSSPPLTVDGAPLDIGAANNTDTRMCRSKDTRETMFRMYVLDDDLLTGFQASAEGTLGQQTSATVASSQTILAPGSFMWPVQPSGVSRITSCMNATDPSYRIHDGVDIAAPLGSRIVAVADGDIVFAQGGVSGFENYIGIRHANGSITGYGHNQQNLFTLGPNQAPIHVKQGDTIAYVGSRGNSSGPHVHFNYIPKPSPANSPWTNSNTLSANPLYNNLMPKPADVPDAPEDGDGLGCLSPKKLKER